MKQFRKIAGITLITLGGIFALLALVFPHNPLFTAFWNIGMFTLRGEASLMVVYIASALAVLYGGYLLLRGSKKRGE